MTPTPGRDRPRSLPRLLARLLAVLVLTVAAGIGLVGPAAAHNVLIASDPADGAVLQQSPSTVRLTFDQPVQDFEPIVTVVGPDGQRYESGDPVVDSTVVSAQVSALPAAGSYVIAYRVVSADGHPVQGELRFELAQATPATAGSATAGSASGAASTPESSAAASSDAATSSPTPATAVSTTGAAAAPVAESSGLTGWMWAAIALAALLVAAAVTVLVRRPRQRE